MKFSRLIVGLGGLLLLADMTMDTNFIGSSQGAWAAETKIAFSGEIRVRGEYSDDRNFNENIADRGSFVGQRSRLNLDLKAGEIQGYLQAQDSRTWGEDSNNGPAGTGGFVDTAFEQQAIDMRQAYVQIPHILSAPITLRYGRQVLAYGDERLIGAFEWSNFSRAYDGIKLSYASVPVDMDIFTVKLFEADENTDSDFGGLYATLKAIPRNTLDLYVLINTGDVGKSESTIGTRLNGGWNALDYTGEFANQSGDFSSSQALDAYAFALKAGYTIGDLLGGLRFGLEYDFATGNDTATSANEAFQNLYPTNHLLYGLNDNGNAWTDLKALALTLKAEPSSKFWFTAEYWNLQRDTGAGKEGDEINVQAGYAYAENLNLLVQLMTFLPDSASGDDAQQYAVLQSTFKF